MGPIGHDVGELFSFPIFLVLEHGMNGHKEVVDSLLDILDQFWTDYALALMEVGQHNDEYLCKTYRSAIGWAGWYLYFFFYFMNNMEDFLLLFGSPSSVEHAKDFVGYIGLQFMRLAFGNNDLDSQFGVTPLDVSIYHRRRSGTPFTGETSSRQTILGSPYFRPSF